MFHATSFYMGSGDKNLRRFWWKHFKEVKKMLIGNTLDPMLGQNQRAFTIHKQLNRHHQSIDHILHFATIVFNHPHCQQQPSSSSQCPPPPPPYHHHDPKIIQTRSITLCKQPPSLTALPPYIDSSSSQNRFAQEYNQQCASIPSYEYNPRCSLLLLLLLHTAATIYFYFYFCIYNTTATSSYSRCHHPLHFTFTNSSDHSLAGLGFVVHLKYGFRDQCGMYAWWSPLVDSETVEHHHHLLHISWREVLA